ncbi:hypothetical protein WJX81_003981 [Elliptochloris bilobata]|uniref:Eukaryotic translation initiation factor 3 subunit K n=1 Tax=Elliptochloris bilobata TaxID=381761 RepID=A0AAW1QVZ7_9CHLO
MGKVDVSGANGYNPKLQQSLEEYVAEQAKSGTYDLDANLALLRHYDFAPEGAKLDVIATVLIKALMRLPEPDFAQLLQLVPEQVQDEQPVAALVALTQHLEGARFRDFWLAQDACRDVVAGVTGFYEAVRAYILATISHTCRRVSKGTLAECLRLEDASLDALIEEKVAKEGWSVAAADMMTVVTLPENEQNVIHAQGTGQGGFRFEPMQLAQILQVVQ